MLSDLIIWQYRRESIYDPSSSRFFRFSAYAATSFNEGSRHKKRQIFAGISSNLLLKDGKLELDLKKPLRAVGEGPNFTLPKNSPF